MAAWMEDIRRRADEASPGPWRVVKVSQRGLFVVQNGVGETVHGGADATFIAHARDDVPRLLGTLEAVRRVVKLWANSYVLGGRASIPEALMVERLLSLLGEDHGPRDGSIGSRPLEGNLPR